MQIVFTDAHKTFLAFLFSLNTLSGKIRLNLDREFVHIPKDAISGNSQYVVSGLTQNLVFLVVVFLASFVTVAINLDQSLFRK